METIQVRIPTARDVNYEVIVGSGLFDVVATDLAGGLVPGAHRYVVITDATVEKLYAAALLRSLSASGLKAEVISFPAGEESKTRQTKELLEDRLARLGCGRDTCVIALGGGVVTDLAGFVAATYQRGLPYINIPTTLLAAADASIGGKTGVDTAFGKNQIGAFHHPRRVYIDIATWQTLPAEQVRNGLAETIKHAVISDIGFFEYLKSQAVELGRGSDISPEVLLHLALTNAQIKQAVVQDDPLEQGKRAVLNFGHTLGHALENLSDYSLLHGYAVSIGMVFAARLGEHLGFTSAGAAKELEQLLSSVGLPVELPRPVDADALIVSMQRDKKNREQEIRFVFLKDTGTIYADGGHFTQAVDTEILRSFISSVSD